MQSKTKPQRISPIHSYHESMDARFAPRAGWLVPEIYTTPETESTTLNERVGLADISARGKITVIGDLAPSVMAVRWADIPTDPGEVSWVGLNDTLIAKLTSDELLILTAPGNEHENSDSLEKEIANQNSFVTVLDRTSS